MYSLSLAGFDLSIASGIGMLEFSLLVLFTAWISCLYKATVLAEIS